MQCVTVIILIVSSVYCVWTINLNENDFDKVINKFNASLIKFDISDPFGYTHKAFTAFAKECMDEKDFLIANFLVTNANADKSNQAFAKKYGATTTNLPVIKLFLQGQPEPIPFYGKGFTSDELRRFVREKTGMYLGLPGCIQEFDILTTRFMKGKKNERKKVLKKTEELLISMGNPSAGKIYKRVMENVLERGEKIIHTKLETVKKLLTMNISVGPKKELETEFNILQTFKRLDVQAKLEKEDL